MSVIVNGMEMPTRCADCWLMDGEDSWCCASRGKHIDGDYRYGIKDRPDWCPLVEAPEWISVEERLPEIKEPVLAMVHWDDYGDTMMCYGCRYKTRWYLWNCVEGELLKDFTVTHWMPLPEPPKEDKA